MTGTVNENGSFVPDEVKEGLDALFPESALADTQKLTLREQVGQLHQSITIQAYGLWDKKSRDYGNELDPFANFHTFGSYGILVRMFDKLARLKSFEEKGFHAVTDESTEDTVKDLINYGILYLAYRKLGVK